MDRPSFTSPDLNLNYTVHYDQDEGGMEVLYDITNIFLDAVIKGNFFPDGFLSEEKFPDLESVEQNFPTEAIDNWVNIVRANIPILVCIVLGLLLAITSLIYGLVFCCCCQAKKTESQDNGFKKLVLSVLLFLLLVITSLGCMWFFLGAKTSQRGLDKIPEDITDILHDGDLYMNNTLDQLEYLLQDNFDEVIDEFKGALDQVAIDFKAFADTMKTDISFSEILGKAESFLELINDTGDIRNTLVSVSNSIKQITAAVEEIQSKICPNQQLDTICKFDPQSQFPSELDPNFIPSIKTDEISHLIEILKNIENDIDGMTDNAIDDYFPTIEEEIEKIKSTLKETLDDFSGQIENIQEQIFRNNEIRTTLEEIRDDFFPYFSISLYVLGSLLVVILAIFMAGMCLGCCTKQGSGMASTGSSIMFTANAFFFLLAILLFILCTAFFTVGAMGQKAICKTLDNPEDSEIIDFINPLISSEMTKKFNEASEENIEVDFDLAKVISDIHYNTAIYPLLQLHYIFDIENLTNWREEYGINPVIDEAWGAINTTIDQLLSNQDNLDEQLIIEVAKEIDKITFTPLLDESLLTEIEGQIEEFKKLIETFPEVADLVQSIFVAFNNIKDNVELIQTIIRQILFKFGDGTNLQVGQQVTDTFDMIHKAFEFFEGPSIREFFDSSVTTLTNVVDVYVVYAIDAAEHTIGATGPLANIYDATYTVICIEIIAPFNSVWSGLGWCLLLILIPVTWLVTALRKLFSATKQSQSMRPHNNSGYRNGRNPAARAVSYEEVPLPSYKEKNSRISAYDTRQSSYSQQPSAPPPYYSDQGRASYQQYSKR